MDKEISKTKNLKGEINISADKSISHRGVILSSLANGEGVVKNFLKSEDIYSTINCIKALGIEIDIRSDYLKIKGKGLNGLTEPTTILDCGNSGTTMRLLSGVLSGTNFFSVLSGDISLNNRPMKRIIEPLSLMGAIINARQDDYAPMTIRGSEILKAIEYIMPVASAQVKSAILLAGLKADGITIIKEKGKTRDHTERMLKSMGADIQINDSTISIKPETDLEPQEFIVPADISSAAFFIVAALITEGSQIMISEVGINPTRAGIIDVLRKMGGNIKLENKKTIGGEPVADIIVTSSQLNAINISEDTIPTLIDEIPILAVAMATAEGESTVTGASELRVKETDRIKAISSELRKLGVNIIELEDGFKINGRSSLIGCTVNSYNDHRIAMSLAVAGLVAEKETIISGAEVVSISFPDFWDILNEISKKQRH